MSSTNQKPKGMTRIIGTHERRLEFDTAVKEIMRQRRVAAQLQTVARQQRQEMKKMEKIEKKMERQKSEVEAEKIARKRAELRQAQMENLRTLQGLREEMKPQDVRKLAAARRASDGDSTDGGGGGGGRFKSLASNLLAVKKIEGEQLRRSAPPRRASICEGEFSRRNIYDDDQEDRSVLSSVEGSDEGEKSPDEPQIFSATLAAMKLAATTTHYQANGQNRFNAALAAMQLNEMSSRPDWHKSVDEGDDNGIDESLEDYESRPMPLNMRGTSGLELINVEDLKPTSRGGGEEERTNGINLQDLVPTPRRKAGGDKDSSWLDETNNKMNYDEDETNSHDNSYQEEEENGDYSGLDFHPTPLPLNPLREDSEASLDCMVPPPSDAYHSSGEKLNFQRGNLLNGQGKTPSGKTNRTKSTNTMHSSNDSVGGASDVSSLSKRRFKMSRLKNSFRNSFTKRGSGGSVTSAVSELTSGSRRAGSSQSVGTSASSKWRRRLSGLTGGGSFKNSNASPPEFVEAKGKSGDRRQALKSGHYVSGSMVSDLTNLSSSRTLSRATSRRSVDEGSVSHSVCSRFGDFFDDSSHAQALSDALSVHSQGTRQSTIKSYYRFPTHEHPLVRIRPIELFPNSPGWQCDSCSMETTNMKTMAYVSTDRNFIVCRKCFASLGSKIESS